MPNEQVVESNSVEIAEQKKKKEITPKKRKKTKKKSGYKRKAEVRKETSLAVALSNEESNALNEAINNMMTISETDEAEEQQKKRDLKERMDAFQRSRIANNAIKPPSGVISRRLTWGHVEDFLAASGLGYRDLFEIMCSEDGQRAKLSWPKQIEADMCELLDSWDEQKRSKALNIVVGALSEPMKEIYKKSDESAAKLFRAEAIRGREPFSSLKKIKDDQQLRTAKDNYCSDRYWKKISFSKFPKVTKAFDVSFHWLADIDKNHTVLAKNESTEMVMDAFCLITDDIKKIIYSGACLYATEHKRKE